MVKLTALVGGTYGADTLLATHRSEKPLITIYGKQQD